MTNSVTVIIPTYNRAPLIGRAIASVLASVSPGDEILVIDDGSKDDTESVVRAFGPAVRYVRIENSGPGAARNVGIRLSKNPLVTFLDSDDEWVPDKLALQRAVMAQNPDLVFCFCNLQCRMPGGEVIPDVLSIWRQSACVGSADAPSHLSGHLGPGVPFSSIGRLPIGRADFGVHTGDMYLPLMDVLYVSGITVMVRKELGGALFRNDEDTRLMEDWSCYARLAKSAPAAYLDCELSIQNAHSGPRLTGVDDIRQSTMRIEVLQQVWGRDESFLRVHGDRYQRLLSAQYRYRARVLITQGRLAEAREDLDRIGGGPWSYRLLTMIPTSLVTGLVSLRRSVLGRWREA